ncbi:hypothetical protein [Chitinophaga sp. S165]|uniref:hypothetical protein n=1 Tax=Chitinophaga sp. S165 TaxID=2135462 RepID=UPI000D70C702|nr:hypothetical protein [Chitinophaga sp. S165]PWV56412.1 hypothetical protein C7475_101927 [Chitinophaga sp. S165]
MNTKIDYNNLILTNLWMLFILKLVCLIIGFQIVRHSWRMMYEGIKGEYKFTSDLKGLKGGIVSSSPGLLFLILGVFLIAYGLFVRKDVMFIRQPVHNEAPDLTVPNDTLNFKF